MREMVTNKTLQGHHKVRDFHHNTTQPLTALTGSEMCWTAVVKGQVYNMCSPSLKRARLAASTRDTEQGLQSAPVAKVINADQPAWRAVAQQTRCLNKTLRKTHVDCVPTLCAGCQSWDTECSMQAAQPPPQDHCHALVLPCSDTPHKLWQH